MAIGKELTKVQLAYKNMLSRCYNPNNASFANYGGRGIGVCPEWRASRGAFVAWALANGHRSDLSLDRKENELGYSPGNCRWATVKTQLRNQRRNHRLTIAGDTRCAADWAEIAGVSQDTLLRRVLRGTSSDKLLTAGRINAWGHGTRAGYEGHKCRCDACRASNAKRHRAGRARRKFARGNEHGSSQARRS